MRCSLAPLKDKLTQIKSKIGEWLRGIEWESVSPLRSIVVLRVGYLGAAAVPVIAYGIVLWNDWHPYRKPIHLPFNLFLTFLASTLLSVGHLLNEIFVPKLIKTYGTLHYYRRVLAEFVTNQKTITQADLESMQLQFSSDLEAKLPGHPLSALDEIAAGMAGTLSKYMTMPSKDHKPLTECDKDWKAANECRPWMKLFIVVCYISAGGIAAYLALVQLCRVFRAVLAEPAFWI
jgi:hypothetical protein